MASRTVAIAPVRLARQTVRLLTPPAMVALAGSLAMGAGVLQMVATPTGNPLALLLVIVGALLVAAGAWMAAVLLSIRLDVEVSGLRLRWLGGERRYRLSRGAVTRVTIGGSGGVRLRPRFGALGWAFGRARLRDEEVVDVVRLAPSRSLVLIPTEHGRLGVAPADERELVDALTAAARVQQRLDDAAASIRPVPIAVSAPESAYGSTASAAPRLLTGIERAILEERLSAQRVAAMQAAEQERQAAMEAARLATLSATQSRFAPPSAPPARAPLVPARAALATAVSMPALSIPVAVPRPERTRLRAAWRRPAWMTLPSVQLPPLRLPAAIGTPGMAIVVAAPLLVALAAWISINALGWGVVGSSQRPLIVPAMVLGGPLAAAAALFAAVRFPRLAGLVAVTGLLSMLLVGRSLAG